MANPQIVKLQEEDCKLVIDLISDNDKDRLSYPNIALVSTRIFETCKAFVKKGLTFNKKTGITSVGNEWISRYSNNKQIPKYESRDEVVEWEFSGLIKNEANKASYLIPDKPNPDKFIKTGKSAVWRVENE